MGPGCWIELSQTPLAPQGISPARSLGREGYLEEGTLGSALRSEEIHLADRKEVWGVLALLELGKVQKRDWSLRSTQRNLNLTGNRQLGREAGRLVAGSEMGPSWHKAKGLHGKKMLEYSLTAHCGLPQRQLLLFPKPQVPHGQESKAGWRE